jgi:hypothetical protein
MNITWNIYQGSMNLSTKNIHWISIDKNLFKNFFLGLNSKNLTIRKDLFSNHQQTIYWRFEVIYIFQSEMNNHTFDIELNQSPRNGFCSINPFNGTTTTLFTIDYSNWFDEDQIKDYTFYGLKLFFFFFFLKNKIILCLNRLEK